MKQSVTSPCDIVKKVIEKHFWGCKIPTPKEFTAMSDSEKDELFKSIFEHYHDAYDILFALTVLCNFANEDEEKEKEDKA